MAAKKIKPYTIVPPELYVTRQADTQLREIINDMGRPGYVLVSRQMGKTNLLLNAKREHDSPDDCFSYLDVSNTFSDLRSFFRNIVDTTVMSKDSLCDALLTKIADSRESTNSLQPHKEHELELKKILEVLTGKLVICLDEIDALTSVDYSDNVFSLIRSIYFSGRTNFPSFKRLTYVLSGVADPSELIKNKAISPFNIGEKIYLDDFSISETRSFISQCGLDFSEEIVDRIYYWTSGNPRVTWDLCSAIESYCEKNSLTGSDSIDSQVQSLYLTAFDLPPFDHIRTRVQVDKELRNAVISMHYGKSNSLSDKIKDKLYLSGISTPKQSSGDILFKNRIMAECLSEKWISDVESELLTLDERANEKVKLKRYEEAIALFKESAAQASDLKSAIKAKMNVGFCYTQLGDLESALKEYEGCDVNLLDNERLLAVKQHWSGICYMFTNNIPEAIHQFRGLLKSNSGPEKGSFYYEACINLASALLAQAEGSHVTLSEVSAEVKDLLDKVVSSALAENNGGEKPLSSGVLYTAYYQFSRYYALTKNDFERKRYLELALLESENDVKGSILLELASTESDSTSRLNHYKTCSQLVLDNGIASGNDRLNQLQFGSSELASLIVKLLLEGDTDEARRLIQYIASTPSDTLSATNLIIMAAQSAINEGNLLALPSLCRVSMDMWDWTDPNFRLILQLSILIRAEGDDDVRLDMCRPYVENFITGEHTTLHEADFRVSHDIFIEFLRTGELEECEKFLQLANDAFSRTSESNQIAKEKLIEGALVLILLKLRLDSFTDKEPQISQSLSPYIKYIMSTDKISLTYFPDEFGDDMRREFKSLIYPHPTQKTHHSEVSRNQIIQVRYANGKEKVGKFKKFAQDLKQGKCSII